MIAAFLKAVNQLGDPRLRRVLWLSLAGAVAVLALLAVVAGWLISQIELLPWGWAEWVVDIATGIGIVVLVWLTFPGVAGLVMGLLLEDVAAAVEERHYPGLGPPRRQPVGEAIRIAAKFAVVTVTLNLLALPIYFLLPGVNLFVFYALNGYLLGREYFELVALRRLDGDRARVLRRANQGTIFLAGALIAFLLTVPLVNLVMPLVATAFMAHLFETLRRRVGM